MSDSTKQEAADAWKSVLAHPAADLKAYLMGQGIEFRGTVKPAPACCPLCQKKGSFGLLPGKEGGWLFKCHVPTCDGFKSGGIARFIEIQRGVDWKEARRILHELTGIEAPYARDAREKESQPKTGASRKQSPVDQPDPSDTTAMGGEPDWSEMRGGPPPEEASSATEPDAAESEEIGPIFMKLPDIGKNAYEMFWDEMSLTPAHRSQLKSKRGLNDAWINALGFVSATRANFPKLTELLARFPEKELLKMGLAQRDNYTRKIKVAGMLCGTHWDRDAREEKYEERVVIPYINSKGRIIGLRPHKRGLSPRSYRKEESDDFYNKTAENLRIVYGEGFLNERPKEWEHACVIAEGEFKAAGVRMCGIPAIGFQGIEYFLQNKQSEQAIEDTVKLLRDNKIREVVVVFDNEAKLDKPFHERFNAEIWARYTALVLGDHGIKTFFGVLPDAWRDESGKADWDGRLAWHVRKTKTHAAGLKAATAEFTKFLFHRGGERSSVRPPPRQMDWFFDLKEDIIMQALAKLRHVSKIFTGSSHELELAGEFTNWCHEDYKDKLGISKLTAALRSTYGGYYIPGSPSEALEKRALEALTTIDAILAKHDEEMHLTEIELRQYRAARRAAYTILYRFPKTFTDFTCESKYKVLCTEADGSTRLDRLIVFKDSTGRKSMPIQMAGDKLNSSQELRKFFPKIGPYHWLGNQKECDLWLQEIDVQNYQRTITQIDTYGWNQEVGIYIMGDCAVANGRFIFPDKHGIIWHDGLGYKNSEGVASGTAFCHKPPCLWQDAEDPRSFHDAIDWRDEQREVGQILRGMEKDFCDAFGSITGLAALGSMLQYMAHPEIRRFISGKPGLWIQGKKGSGKTKLIEAAMRIYGFPRNYGMIGLGSTKVGIERNLSQFCCLPVTIDEWRNKNASPDLVSFITNAYNEIGISKGTMAGTKSTRKSSASTIPVISGEDGATDPALCSRYMRLVMAAAQRKGSPQEQRGRYFQMIENADSYHRVGRFLFKNREAFAARIVELTKAFMAEPATAMRITGDREQEVGGVCYSTILAAHEFIDADVAEFSRATEFKEWILAHMGESARNVEHDSFTISFFADSVNMIKSQVPHSEKYLRMIRGHVSKKGEITALQNIISEGGKLIVLVAYTELYREHLADKGRVRQDASIALTNIRAELKAEDAWIERRAVSSQHRFRLSAKNGGSDIKRTYWALDYEKCTDELKDIFRDIYERELQEVDYALNDEDEVVHVTDLKKPTDEPNPF